MKTCERCQKPFTCKRPRRFCDRRCAATVSASTRGTPAWSPNEQDYLAMIAGTLPLRDLVKRFQQRARSQGWPQRTDTAINVKLKRLGESRKCTLDNFTIWELARALGVKFDRVEEGFKFGNFYHEEANYDNSRQVIEPYAVWTGSFNMSENATKSLENAVYIQDKAIARAYYNEWAQIEALSEPLDWETAWSEPEWRVGS